MLFLAPSLPPFFFFFVLGTGKPRRYCNSSDTAVAYCDITVDSYCDSTAVDYCDGTAVEIFEAAVRTTTGDPHDAADFRPAVFFCWGGG